MSRDKLFEEHIERAKRIVASWPKWKQVAAGVVDKTQGSQMSEPKAMTDLELMDAALIYGACSRPIMNLVRRLQQRNAEIAELKSELKTFLPDVYHDWINAEETECYADCRRCYLNVLVGDEK